MRMDKLTTSLQMALGDAQSTAIGKEHQFIEPVHVIQALLQQSQSSVSSLLMQSGVSMPQLIEAIDTAIDRLPQVQGGAAGEVHISRDCG